MIFWDNCTSVRNIMKCCTHNGTRIRRNGARLILRCMSLFVVRYSWSIALLDEAVWHNCAIRVSRISQRAAFLPFRPSRAMLHTYQAQLTQCRRITGIVRRFVHSWQTKCSFFQTAKSASIGINKSTQDF